MLASPIGNGDMDEKLHLAANAKGQVEADLQSEMDDSSIDSESEEEDESGPEETSRDAGATSSRQKRRPTGVLSDRIIVSGSIPSFGPGHIIRQRASCHGRLRQMEPEEEVKALNLPPSQVGRVHIDGPVSYWLETREKFHTKYSTDLERFRKIKSVDYEKAKKHGFLTRDLHGERPPQCALVSWYDLERAQEVGRSVDGPSGKSNTAVNLYMKISQKADREQAGDVQATQEEDPDRANTQSHQTLEKITSRLSQAGLKRHE